MKITFLQIKLFTYLGAIILFACTAPAQSPAIDQTPAAPVEASAAPTLSATPDPYATPPVAAVAGSPIPAATAAPSATVAPVTTPAASPDTEEEFDRAVERKIKRHFNISVDGDNSDNSSDEDHWWIPLVVLIGCVAFFGTPVAVVATIMYFSFSKSRAMHKTVRMMVEKGQPVPESLLNPPPVVRQRSDLRRGIVLLMIGAGLVIFLGAVNDWDGGAWSIGIIPFMIGLGYLLVWKLDVHRGESSPKV